MAWWVAPALMAGGSIYGAISQSNQNKNQAAWNRYNAGMQYGVDSMNNNAAMQLGMMNAGLQVASGRINAGIALEMGKINAELERTAAKINAGVSREVAAYNASMLHATTLYNDSLLEDELAAIWDAADLDLMMLDRQRQEERGAIVADQAASGTVIGEGSNAEVLIGQQTEAALDAFIVRHNADQQAAQVNNARAKGIWEAQVAMEHIRWQGEMEGYVATANAEVRAAGIMANAYMNAWGSQANANLAAAGIMSQTKIQGLSNRLSTDMRYQAGMSGASMQYSQNQQQINNNLITGLFGAASMGAGSYYMNKPVTPPTGSSWPGGGRTTEGLSYVRGPSLGDPGGSLLGTSYK